MKMDGLTQIPASLTIEKHLMNPPGTSVVIEIDPKTAKAILDTRNGKNRPAKPNKVQQFAADMAKDRWGLTGDTIKFGTNGHLLDGQNRLSASAKVGNPSEPTSSSVLIPRYSVGWTSGNREMQQISYILPGSNTLPP
jgi:hypothetical protein